MLEFNPSVPCKELLDDLRDIDCAYAGRFVTLLEIEYAPESPVRTRDLLHIADQANVTTEERIDLLEAFLYLSADIGALELREIGASIAEPFTGLLVQSSGQPEPLSLEIINAIRLHTSGRLSEERLKKIVDGSEIHEEAERLYGEGLGLSRSNAHVMWASVNAAFDLGDSIPIELSNLIDNCREACATSDARYRSAVEMARIAISAESEWANGLNMEFSFVETACRKELDREIEYIKTSQRDGVNATILAAMLRHLKV